VPLDSDEVPRRAQDFSRMVDAFGGIGPRLWKGKVARMRSERWLARMITDVRRGALRAEVDCALHMMAHFRGPDRNLLSPKLAAIELLNVIRPTVAVSWYVAFAAHALHAHPEAHERIAREAVGETAGEYADLFMQEVRRSYPFTPFLGAKVRSPFVWKGQHFERGTLVLLDLYGTNRDASNWDAPDEFRPERFAGWQGDPYRFIPQGGGPRMGHRCPGEWITMHNIALALHFLTRCATYRVPAQDLSIDLRRMPAQPKSGFVMREVRATAALDAQAPRRPSAIAARDSAASIEPREPRTDDEEWSEIGADHADPSARL
jgi:fatty-acid peroxygenase